MMTALLILSIPAAAYWLGRRDGRKLDDLDRQSIFDHGYLHGVRMERQQREIEGASDLTSADWWKLA